MRGRILRSLIATMQAVFVAVIIAVAHSGGGVAAAGSISITGTVTDPSGNGVANVAVTATNPGGSTVAYGPATTDSAGSYELDVDAGTYDFHFTPPSGSSLNPVVDSNVFVVSNQTRNAQLTAVSHNFTGTLTDQNGQAIANTFVTLTSDNGQSQQVATNSSGAYSVPVLPGIYRVSLYFNGTPLHAGWPNTFYLSSDDQFDLTNSDVAQDLQVHMAALTVNVRDSNGNPVSGASLQVDGENGTTGAPLVPGSSNPSYSSSIYADGTTNASGQAVVFVPDGTRFGQSSGSHAAYDNLSVTLSSSQRVYLASPLTVNGSTAVTLTQPVTHIFSGKLTDQNGNPIGNSAVSLYSDDGKTEQGFTNTSGDFSVPVEADTYHVGINNYGSSYQNWPGSFYVSSNQPFDLTATDVTQNLQIDMQPLTVAVNDTNGSPLPNASVRIDGEGGTTGSPLVPGSGYATAVSVNSNSTTNSAGLATFMVPNGTHFGQTSGQQASYDNILADLPDGSTIGLTGPLTVDGPTNITLGQNATHTLSGVLTDQHGNAIKNTQIALNDDNGHYAYGMTNNSGAYSVPAVPGSYHVQVYYSGAPLYTSWPSSFIVDDPTMVDLSTSDVTQNLQVTMQSLTVTVKDVSGTPVAGADVETDGEGGTAPSMTAGSSSSATLYSVSAGGNTNTSGQITFIVPQGTRYGRTAGNTGYDNIMVTLPSGLTLYLNASVTVNGTTSVLFQPTPTVPAAPTGLTAPSPAKTAVLSWNAVTGSTSYNVYRDGTKVATVTTTAYTDATAADGTHSYYVTAVNSGGESAQSNTVPVLIDKTKPTVSFVSPTSFSGGFAVGPTVTVSASDAGSGLQVLVIHVYNSANQLLGICGSATPSQLAAGSMSCNLASLPAGTYSIRAGANDKAGNNQTINSGSFTIGS